MAHRGRVPYLEIWLLSWLAGALSISRAIGRDAAGASPAAPAASHTRPGESAGGAAAPLDDLDCGARGESSLTAVAFGCDQITVVSCSGFSDVVLQFADGSRQHFEGLSGQRAVFVNAGAGASAQVVSVWVKAGAERHRDAAGAGRRFDAPDVSCKPAEEPDVPPPEDDSPPEYEAPPPSEEAAGRVAVV